MDRILAISVERTISLKNDHPLKSIKDTSLRGNNRLLDLKIGDDGRS